MFNVTMNYACHMNIIHAVCYLHKNIMGLSFRQLIKATGFQVTKQITCLFILGHKECLISHTKFFDKFDDVRAIFAEIQRFCFTYFVLIGSSDVVDGLYLLQDDHRSCDAMLTNPYRIIAISTYFMFQFVLVQWTGKSLNSIDCLENAIAHCIALC